MQTNIRWSLKVSRQTDTALRTHLAQAGTRKGDLSKFVEHAVQKEVFARTVASVQARNAGVAPEKIEVEIDEALKLVRLDALRAPKLGRHARSS